MVFWPEFPKRDQNLKFAPLSETTSISAPFIWESPPPRAENVNEKWIRKVSNFIDRIQSDLICQMLANFSGLNPKGPYLSLEKEKENSCAVFTYSIKRAREIRKFHVAVAVVQRRL